MGIALEEYHCRNAREHQLHWGIRLDVVAVGCFLAADLFPLVIAGGLWTEYVRWKAGEQAHSTGIVGGIQRFAPHCLEDRARHRKEITKLLNPDA